MPLHDFWSVKLDPENGASGKCPVYPSEFQAVGLSSDIRCYVLIEYVYGGCRSLVIRKTPLPRHLSTCNHPNRENPKS